MGLPSLQKNVLSPWKWLCKPCGSVSNHLPEYSLSTQKTTKCTLLWKPKSDPQSMFLPEDQSLNSKVYDHNGMDEKQLLQNQKVHNHPNWTNFSKHCVTNLSTSKWCNNNLFLLDRYKVHTQLFPEQEALMRKHFGSSPPPVIEAERNMSLLILTSNSVFNYPIPLPPSVVTIHSLHVKTTSDPLPKVRNSQTVCFFPSQSMVPELEKDLTYCNITLAVTQISP
jgi:hypothetical protein